jgi:SGNH domain (fused to AT3 domains)
LSLYNWRDISKTIVILRQIGVKQIDMVGSVPEWTQNLNRPLYDYALKNVNQANIPSRVLFGLKPEIVALDDEIRAFALEQKVRYVAPRSIMCNANGCLTYVNANSGALTSFDAEHLTKEGSVYLGAHFPD